MGAPRTDLLDRLYGRSEWVGDCLVRMAPRDRDGYTSLGHQGKKWRAHRLAWTLARGEIPEGMTIDHLCKTPACINVMHMEVVTPTENSLRRSGWKTGLCAKGRHDITDPANVRITSIGRRSCRPCWLEYYRQYRANH